MSYEYAIPTELPNVSPGWPGYPDSMTDVNRTSSSTNRNTQPEYHQQYPHSQVGTGKRLDRRVLSFLLLNTSSSACTQGLITHDQAVTQDAWSNTPANQHVETIADQCMLSYHIQPSS